MEEDMIHARCRHPLDTSPFHGGRHTQCPSLSVCTTVSTEMTQPWCLTSLLTFEVFWLNIVAYGAAVTFSKVLYMRICLTAPSKTSLQKTLSFSHLIILRPKMLIFVWMSIYCTVYLEQCLSVTGFPMNRQIMPPRPCILLKDTV